MLIGFWRSIKNFILHIEYKTKVIRADLLDFYFDFEDIHIKIYEEKKLGTKKLVKKEFGEKIFSLSNFLLF